MNVIYLICDENAVRIPFTGFNDQVFRQLKLLGGTWDAAYFGFVFNHQIDVKKFKQYFSIVFIVSEKSPPQSIPLAQFQVIGMNDNLDKIGGELSPQEKYIEEKSRFYKQLNNAKKDIEYLQEPMLKKLEAELGARKFAVTTRKAYVLYVKRLCNTIKKFPENIFVDDVKEFLSILEKEEKSSAAKLNLALSGIKFFYRYVIKDNRIKEQKRPVQDKKLPKVLSAEEILNLIYAHSNEKHRLLLMLVYSSGLRVGEAVKLKKEDIDFSRKVIYINLGKGRKDRYTMLSEKAAHFLSDYLEKNNIEKWLFPGQSGKNHLAVRSAQRIFENAIEKAAITKNVSIHDLRHSFATHLLESGTDIRYIQDLLGHSSIRTTERYTHVAKKSVLKIKSPLDGIM